ncbi:membrane-spanning 4-domains subfamily A member 4A-like [Tamandua tetradactyla]|uniref:membrane-spanning 4-domains subfamily A member 4A-like n=1 Tax=Tamandua tetradactyla TaxID=48850 RepID=UPI00405435D8
MAHNQNVNISQLHQAGSWNFPHQQQNMQKFLNGKPKILGATQILIGLMKICLWAMWKTASYHVYVHSYLFTPLAFISIYPVWGSLCFFLSGIMSIVAGSKLTMNLVRGSLAMNIISAIVSAVGLALLTLDVNSSVWEIRGFKAAGVTYTLKYESETFKQVFLFAILILTMLEMCISLTLSAFGYMVACFVTQVVVQLAPADNRPSEVTLEHEYEELTCPYIYVI